MAKRTIRTGIGTYLRRDGQWDYGRFGEEVDVHKEDVDRFDRLNPEEPEVAETEDVAGEQVDGEQAGEEREFPEGDPVEAWKGDELKAYAKAHELSLGSATTKAEMVAALAEAAAAKQAAAEQPPAGDSQE